MPIQWNREEVEKFFGVTAERALATDSDPHPEVFYFDYAGSHLRYGIWVEVEKGQVSISGDTTSPFGPHSLYEIYVPCDSISFLPVTGYQVPALAVWYGPHSDLRNRRLIIYRREDGDLTVWPAFPFPEEHELRNIGSHCENNA